MTTSMEQVTFFKQLTLDTINRVYYNRLTSMSGGNISTIDSEGNIYITPSGIDKGLLTIDDIVVVKADGTIVGKHKPSMEWRFHRDIYLNRSDIRAVVHAHAVSLVGFASLNMVPRVDCSPVYSGISKISNGEFRVPGSLELADKVLEQFKKGSDAVMMDSHGAVTGGKDLLDAFSKYEMLNSLCKAELASAVFASPISSSKTKTLPITAAESNYQLSIAEQAIAKDMIAYLKRSYNQGLVTTAFGICSVRTDNGFLINACDKDIANLSVCDILAYKDGILLGCGTACLVQLVAAIFAANNDINALFLAAPYGIMAHAIKGEQFRARKISECYLLTHDVFNLPLGLDTKSMQNIAVALTRTNPVLIVNNLGVITIGKNIVKAFDRLEVAELNAESLLESYILNKNTQDIIQSEVTKMDNTFDLW